MENVNKSMLFINDSFSLSFFSFISRSKIAFKMTECSSALSWTRLKERNNSCAMQLSKIDLVTCISCVKGSGNQRRLKRWKIWDKLVVELNIFFSTSKDRFHLHQRIHGIIEKKLKVFSSIIPFLRIPCFFVSSYSLTDACVKIYNLHELQNLGGACGPTLLDVSLLHWLFMHPRSRVTASCFV